MPQFFELYAIWRFLLNWVVHWPVRLQDAETLKLPSFFSDRSLLFALVVSLLLSASIGCQPNDPGSPRSNNPSDRSPQQNQSTSAPQAGPDGATILSDLVARYRTATSYQDKAILYLNYRLEGNAIQEPHPFSTIWDRHHHLASKIFNAQIHCNGRLLACYVFDIETANLDTQELLIPVKDRLPISTLYDDPIVRHFVGGYSELPLDETAKDQPPRLIPPPLSLLSGQLPFGWIEQAEKVQRLPDATIDRTPCYVVRSLYHDSTCDIWIDQKTGLLVQISLPLKLMVRKVLTSGEIADVQLLVRFHDAIINQPIAAERFAIPNRKDATPVRKFVAIPTPFPSDLIGEPSPAYQLLTPEGEQVGPSDFKGKTTTLLWLGEDPTFEAVKRLNRLKKTLPGANFHLGIVYTDADLARPGSGSYLPEPRLARILAATRLAAYYDPQLAASTQLKLKSIPTVVVWDSESRMEFAKAITDNPWTEDLKVAMQRIDSGEDVAEEMQQNYQNFLDAYQKELLAMSASDWLPNADAMPLVSSTQEPNAATRSSDREGPFLPTGFRTHQLPTKLRWSNPQFQQAGNIQIDRRGRTDRIFVFDGWRTIVELDSDGKTVGRKELDLPEGTAVSCLRPVGASQNETGIAWAAFNVRGDRVYLFDRDWELVTLLPNSEFQHRGVLDVVSLDQDQDGNQELIVSFAGKKGIYQFDLKKRTVKSLAPWIANSLTRTPRGILFCQSNRLGILDKPPETFLSGTGTTFHRVISANEPGKDFVGVLYSDTDRRWFVARLDNSPHGSLKMDWQQSIGPQWFQSTIEPVAMARSPTGQTLLAFADTEHRVNLLDQGGHVLGQMSLPRSIRGLALLVRGNRLSIIVSDSKGVYCFEMASP